MNEEECQRRFDAIVAAFRHDWSAENFLNHALICAPDNRELHRSAMVDSALRRMWGQTPV